MNENAFSYTYSATCNQEVLNIRKKYLPHEETKLEELKRLDSLVQNSGVMESLCAGIGGCLAFGLGLCLAMEVIGQMIWLGVILGLVGTVGMSRPSLSTGSSITRQKRSIPPAFWNW